MKPLRVNLLLSLFAMCVWCWPPPNAAAASPPSRSAFRQQPTAPLPHTVPPDTPTQVPAPILRPKPLKLAPAPQGSTGSTGAVARPKPRAAASGSTGSTGSAVGTPAPKPLHAAAPAKTQPAGTAAVPFNRTTIVLDPAHGGVDGGSRITDTLQEKDVDLAFAFKLRSLLTARGFNVVLTRDTDAAAPPDSGTPLTLDDRAGNGNHLHPVACLLVHATGAGKGVHLYSSELTPIPLQPVVVPWLTAQAAWVNSSRALQRQLGTALTRAEIPLVLSRASIRPLDSLACPALVLELAPNGDEKGTVNDSDYQQRVANAIASAMIFWQSLAQAPVRQLPTPPATSVPPAPNMPPSLPSVPGAQP